MKRALLLCGLVFLPGCALWKRIFPERLPAGVPPDSVAIWGVYGRAGGVALADHLAFEEAQATRIRTETHDPEDRAWESNLREAECWARPEAYRLYVSYDEKSESYTIFVWPLPEVCLGKQAYASVGGGAKYEIDARTFSVVRKELME